MTSVPSDVRLNVLIRDGFRCIAPAVDRRCGPCRDTWSDQITRWPHYDRGPQYVTMSHTKSADELMLGRKAPHDEAHLVTLCPFHHQGTSGGGSNWEAANRDKIRHYLEKFA